MKSTGRFKQGMHGSVAIMVGLAIVVMIAFLGIVVDLGRLYTNKTELSNASDACALAAAGELKGDSDSLIRADNAAQTVSNRNLTDFQRNNVAFTLNNTVTFSQNLQGTYLTQGSVAANNITNMHYAQCTFTQGGLLPWFMQVMGFGAQTVAAHAIAGLSHSQSACALPVGLIQQSTTTCPDGTTPDAYGFCIGQWYGSVISNNTITGNFNWVDFTPPNGGSSELSALLTGNGWCNTTTGMQIGETGQATAIMKAWQTRFGIYQGSYSNTNAPPDLTGYAYTPATCTQKFNAYSGTCTDTNGNTVPNYLSAQSSNLAYQGDTTTGLNNVTNGTTVDTSAQLSTYGATNRRLALMPIVPTNAWVGSQTAPLLDYACVLMLEPLDGSTNPAYVEYRGLASLSTSPCNALGLPGGTTGPLVPTLVR